MVGNFTQPWCSEVHWAKSLEKLGHEVTRVQENQLDRGWTSEVMGHDMFLWVRTWENYVTLSDIQQIRAMGVVSVNVHLDLFIGISREATLDTDPRWRTDFVFTADGDPRSQEIFEAHGINHYWLKPGVFDEGCYMKEPNNDPVLSGNVVFVGGGKEYSHPEWPYRRQLIEFLEQNYGSQYGKFGHPQRLVREDDLNQLYANAKIVIGDSLNVGFEHPNYWSDRVYETTGRGGFIIHPYIKGLEKEFKLNGPLPVASAASEMEIVTYPYGDFEQLKTTIDYYLEHPFERHLIQNAGFERTKNTHTYTQRMKEMLDVVFGANHVYTTQAKDQVVTLMEPDESSIVLPQYNFKKINLGAGEDPTDGWVNVDVVDLPGIDLVHNLIKFPYPFPDACADEIKAVDVLEHLPNYIGEQNGVIAFIEECHRILIPGGTLYIQTPGHNAEFLWIDPTHVRGFHRESMDFFDPEKHYGQTTGFYSQCKFHVRVEELPNHNLRFWMEKI